MLIQCPAEVSGKFLSGISWERDVYTTKGHVKWAKTALKWSIRYNNNRVRRKSSFSHKVIALIDTQKGQKPHTDQTNGSKVNYG